MEGLFGGKSTEGESEISFWQGRTIFDIRDDIDLQAVGIWGSNTKIRNHEARRIVARRSFSEVRSFPLGWVWQGPARRLVRLWLGELPPTSTSIPPSTRALDLTPNDFSTILSIASGILPLLLT